MGILIDHGENHPESNQVLATKVLTVRNLYEAQDAIQRLVNEGYTKDNLYVIAHSAQRTEHIAHHTNTNTIGLAEEGVITAIANLFRSHGDELRAKLRSMGISKMHAENLEEEMDEGKIVIIGWDEESYEGDDYNPLIDFYPYVNK